jgi:hypothetical protein
MLEFSIVKLVPQCGSKYLGDFLQSSILGCGILSCHYFAIHKLAPVSVS